MPLPTERQTGPIAGLVVPGAAPTTANGANTTGPIPTGAILPLVGSPFSSSPVRMTQPVPVLEELAAEPEAENRGGES